MSRVRRGLAIVFWAILVAPLLLLPLAPSQSAGTGADGTTPRSGLLWPRSVAEWAALPRDLDAYLADRLGSRGALADVSARLRKLVGAPELSGAVVGRNDFLFLRDGLLQSTGAVTHPENADVTAKELCTMGARLRRRGAQLLYAIVPSPAEVYPEDVPSWAGAPSDTTDYDLLVDGALKCGVAALDLRAGLIAAKSDGPVYRRTDTHWTPLGSLTAFNRIAEALDHPEWFTSPQSLRWQARAIRDGDLPRLAGLAPIREQVAFHDRADLPPAARRAALRGLRVRSTPPFVIVTGHSGPTVLILGDSFTATSLPPLLAPFAGRVAWVHYEACAFDWNATRKLRPDIVLVMPAERQALCSGRKPSGLPTAPRWN